MCQPVRYVPYSPQPARSETALSPPLASAEVGGRSKWHAPHTILTPPARSSQLTTPPQARCTVNAKRMDRRIALQ